MAAWATCWLASACLVSLAPLSANVAPTPAQDPTIAGGADESPDAEYEELLQAGQRKLLQGKLLDASTKFEELFEILLEDEVAEDNRYRIGAEVGLQSIELRRGNYEDVRDALQGLPDAAKDSPDVVFLLADAHRSVGAYDEARKLLEKMLARNPQDCQARHRLAAVLHDDGKRNRARALWTENAELTPPPADPLQLAYVARSMFRLGGRRNYESASRYLVQCLKLAPERPEARMTYGELKHAAYGEASGFPSGERDLKKVLENHGDYEPALLAMYRIRSSNMSLDASKTEGFLNRVLDRNPRSVEALTWRGANVLDDRRFVEAARRLNEVLSINPNHRVALCHRAAAAMLLHEDDEFRSYRERALAGDDSWPVCDQILGDHLVRLYRFVDSIPFFEAALAADPKHVPSMHGLARALIYAGDGKRARELLQKCKELEPGLNDPWRNNAIAVQELLEEEYDVVEQGDFRMLLHKEDNEVLRAYLLPIHLEAVEVLGQKYGWKPEGKTTVEVFHTWDDFSVRTIGFRGFTALGACFGRLITLVSPVDGDLRKQDFMWEATAWHEYTHVLTLGLSKHRVPRWLTEGFSVYEERSRERSWERGMQRDLFDAFHNQDIPPVRLMNRLFRGPRILFGYYQGGLIVELIAKRFGFDKALELVRAFGDDVGLEQAFDRALSMSSREFDALLLEYVEKDLLRGIKLVPRFNDRALSERLVQARRDPRDLQARIDLAWGALQRDNPVDSGRWLADVLRADANHAQALLIRAEMLRRRGQLEAAVEHWTRGFDGGADDFDSRIAFGDTLAKMGNAAGAIEQWQRAKACWPTCTEQATAPELRLAKLYREQGNDVQSQMEMKAYCRRTARAYQPRDMLAKFEKDAGNRREELQLLVECNRIDPFCRRLHVRMGEAYEALGKLAQAALEFEVAAAVLPQADRDYIGANGAPPAPDSEEQVTERAELWLRAAELRHEVSDTKRRDALLQRVLQAGAGGDVEDRASELQQKWRGR